MGTFVNCIKLDMGFSWHGNSTVGVFAQKWFIVQRKKDLKDCKLNSKCNPTPELAFSQLNPQIFLSRELQLIIYNIKISI